MKIYIIAIGKIKSKPIRELAGEYASRLEHYFKLERIDVKGEGQALKVLENIDHVIVCDEQGKHITSMELAKMIESHKTGRFKKIAFFIGGPDGIGKDIKARADQFLSLSRMTFPHEMAQTILLEQLYRAATILKGEAYHK